MKRKAIPTSSNPVTMYINRDRANGRGQVRISRVLTALEARGFFIPGVWIQAAVAAWDRAAINSKELHEHK